MVQSCILCFHLYTHHLASPIPYPILRLPIHFVMKANAVCRMNLGGYATCPAATPNLMGIGYDVYSNQTSYSCIHCVSVMCVCALWCVCMRHSGIGMSGEGSVEGIKGKQRIIEICSYSARYSIAQ